MGARGSRGRRRRRRPEVKVVLLVVLDPEAEVCLDHLDPCMEVVVEPGLPQLFLPRLLLMLQQLSMLLLKESICLDLRTFSRMLATLLLLLWIPWALMSRLILRLRREGNLVKFPLLRLLPLPQQL